MSPTPEIFTNVSNIGDIHQCHQRRRHSTMSPASDAFNNVTSVGDIQQSHQRRRHSAMSPALKCFLKNQNRFVDVLPDDETKDAMHALRDVCCEHGRLCLSCRETCSIQAENTHRKNNPVTTNFLECDMGGDSAYCLHRAVSTAFTWTGRKVSSGSLATGVYMRRCGAMT